MARGATSWVQFRAHRLRQFAALFGLGDADELADPAEALAQRAAGARDQFPDLGERIDEAIDELRDRGRQAAARATTPRRRERAAPHVRRRGQHRIDQAEGEPRRERDLFTTGDLVRILTTIDDETYQELLQELDLQKKTLGPVAMTTMSIVTAELTNHLQAISSSYGAVALRMESFANFIEAPVEALREVVQLGRDLFNRLPEVAVLYENLLRIIVMVFGATVRGYQDEIDKIWRDQVQGLDLRLQDVQRDLGAELERRIEDMRREIDTRIEELTDNG